MQINANSALNAAQYTKLQGNEGNSSKTEASPSTLQSDKVTLSSEAMNASSANLRRGGGGMVFPDRKPE